MFVFSTTRHCKPWLHVNKLINYCLMRKLAGRGSNVDQWRQSFLTACEWQARWEAKGPLPGSGHLQLRGCGLRGDEWLQVEEEHYLLQILCLLLWNEVSFSLSLGFSPREFARWKVNNLALERKDFFSLPLPLAPEFIRNIRLLGRRPNLQQVTENLIKKYGTHFLLSATLGGKQHHNPKLIGCQTIGNNVKTRVA